MFSADQDAYIESMQASVRHSIAIVLTSATVFCAPAAAQIYNNVPPPPTYGPTVPPLPPPPQPTPSPLGRSSNSPGAPSSQPKLDTFSDKTARCLHYGATQGLTGGDLAAYARACANN